MKLGKWDIEITNSTAVYSAIVLAFAAIVHMDNDMVLAIYIVAITWLLNKGASND